VTNLWGFFSWAVVVPAAKVLRCCFIFPTLPNVNLLIKYSVLLYTSPEKHCFIAQMCSNTVLQTACACLLSKMLFACLCDVRWSHITINSIFCCLCWDRMLLMVFHRQLHLLSMWSAVVEGRRYILFRSVYYLQTFTLSLAPAGAKDFLGGKYGLLTYSCCKKNLAS